MSSLSRSKGNKLADKKIRKTLRLKKPFNKAAAKRMRDSHESVVASEKIYRDLVELAHEGITMVDPEDNMLFVNKQFATSLGYKASELVGKSLFSVATKATVVRMKKEILKRKRGEKSRYEVILLHRDGSKKYFWLSASPMYGANQKFIGSMGVYADVTEKKLMELKLEKKVKQIDTLYRVYGHARMAKSLGSVLSGITQEIVKAFPCSDHVQARLTFDGKTYSYPKKLKRFAQKIDASLVIAGVKRGLLRVGYSRKSCNGNDGESLREERELIKNVARILTRHMYARDVMGRHRQIIRKSFTSIIIVSGKKITYANPRFYRVFKAKEGDVIGQRSSKFLRGCDSHMVTDGKVVECTGRTLKGENLDLAMIAQRIDYHGKPASLIRINDVSDLRKAQKKLSSFNQELRKTVKEKTLHLEEANKRLQSLNMMKDEFIAVTSHELRSPLTSIRGYLSFLVEDEALEQLSEPYREYLLRAYSTTDSLNYLINNILDVSRLDMGRFELQKQDTDIVRLTKNILDSLSFQFSEKRLELEFENQTGSKQLTIPVDSIRMSQVLRNILDNSIKFTKRGKKISVSIKKESKNVVISLSDQGVGIPKAKIGQIFDKFVQVKNNQTKYKGGVGLGLFIAKCIVELHGGSIKAIKNNDCGITISINLPIEG